MEAKWEPDQADDENVAWARETVAALQPYSSGGTYLNFPGFFEQGDEQLRESYGSGNFDRLVTLKTELDPGNLFGGVGAIRARA